MQPVNDYYEMLQQLEAGRTRARRMGGRFDRESDYLALHSVEDQMQRLGAEARGERRMGDRVVLGEKPSDARLTEIRRHQLELARRALGRITSR